VLNYQWDIGAGQLDAKLWGCGAILVHCAVAGTDAVLEAHSTKLVQGGKKSGDLLG
jgi:hypothetical protein